VNLWTDPPSRPGNSLAASSRPISRSVWMSIHFLVWLVASMAIDSRPFKSSSSLCGVLSVERFQLVKGEEKPSVGRLHARRAFHRGDPVPRGRGGGRRFEPSGRGPGEIEFLDQRPHACRGGFGIIGEPAGGLQFRDEDGISFHLLARVLGLDRTDVDEEAAVACDEEPFQIERVASIPTLPLVDELAFSKIDPAGKNSTMIGPGGG
jgi:hypothetical protein